MIRFLNTASFGFAVLNVILWFAVPAIRLAVDAAHDRLDIPYRPNVGYGVQELLVYYDPWLARVVFPAVFTFGFAAIPILGKRRTGEDSPPTTSTRFAVVASALLIALESVWLYLIAVTIWCRGPNWNFYWPNEEWDPWRVVSINNVNLSQWVWHRMLSTSTADTAWYVRESPGLLLLAIYFLIGIALALRLRWRQPGLYRLMAAALLLQLALLIPIKIACRSLINLKYFVAIPEFVFNI